MNVKNTVKANIQRLRKAKGWNQHDLAAAVGCSHSSIRDIEAKRVHGSVEMLNSIATALGVTLGELFSEKGTETASGPGDDLAAIFQALSKHPDLIRLISQTDDDHLESVRLGLEIHLEQKAKEAANRREA